MRRHAESRRQTAAVHRYSFNSFSSKGLEAGKSIFEVSHNIFGSTPGHIHELVYLSFQPFSSRPPQSALVLLSLERFLQLRQ